MMLRRLLSGLFLALLALPAPAKQLLKDLNFNEGDWHMVGVSLTNYKRMPLQEELKTFILDNEGVMRKIQREWDFQPMYNDWCDWHYAIKFYKNKRLVKTLKINLHCRYITMGVLSFKFEPELLARHKSYYRKIDWATISYDDIETLREDIRMIKPKERMFFYGDVKKYLYDGYFVVGVDDLDLLVERDSVQTDLTRRISEFLNDDNFYLKPYIRFLDDNMEISMRFNVYCNETTYRTYVRKVDHPKVTAHWRSHLHFKRAPDEQVYKINVIGMNKERYRRMR